MSNYDELKKKLDDLRNQMEEAGKQLLFEGLQEVFSKFPQVTSIGWQQYTPYFNDGDVCEFSVCSDEPNINGMCGWDIPDDEEHKDLEEPQKAAAKVLYRIQDEDFKRMFGDHVEVTINRDGTADVSSYYHD